MGLHLSQLVGSVNELQIGQAPTEYEQGKFRSVQALAYRCAEEVAAQLRPGITERQAVSMMKKWLVSRGVDDWFHLPYAWFGDRTSFKGFRFPIEFFPTTRPLEEGMPFILDCAPVVDNFSSDIGYSGSLGKNEIVEKLMSDLEEHRTMILSLAQERRPFKEIYQEIDSLLVLQGNTNVHKRYPFHVIGHQLWKLPPSKLHPRLARFGLKSLLALGRTAKIAAQESWSPLWSGSKHSDHAPVTGLWAVEPHIGFQGVGAKFEEILVVTEEEIFWLDDDLPHVRRWKSDRDIAGEAKVINGYEGHALSAG